MLEARILDEFTAIVGRGLITEPSQLHEWDYKRLICPACEEQQFDKLPTYQASQFEHMRVEACDTCNKDISTVDMTKDSRAIPEVDELASLPLNFWAREKGYTKIQPNLLGM